MKWAIIRVRGVVGSWGAFIGVASLLSLASIVAHRNVYGVLGVAEYLGFEASMSFLSLSGLKKAYESLEGEISKTFDSSQGTSDAEPPPESEEGPSAAGGGPGGKEKEVETKGGEEEENWGDWETQDKGGAPSIKR